MTPTEIAHLRKLLAEATPKKLAIERKSFGFQLVDEYGFAWFTWKPELWNDPAKGQVLHAHQLGVLALGELIAAAPAALKALLDEVERLEALGAKPLARIRELEAEVRDAEARGMEACVELTKFAYVCECGEATFDPQLQIQREIRALAQKRREGK